MSNVTQSQSGTEASEFTSTSEDERIPEFNDDMLAGVIQIVPEFTDDEDCDGEVDADAGLDSLASEVDESGLEDIPHPVKTHGATTQFHNTDVTAAELEEAQPICIQPSSLNAYTADNFHDDCPGDHAPPDLFPEAIPDSFDAAVNVLRDNTGDQPSSVDARVTDSVETPVVTEANDVTECSWLEVGRKSKSTHVPVLKLKSEPNDDPVLGTGKRVEDISRNQSQNKRQAEQNDVLGDNVMPQSESQKKRRLSNPFPKEQTFPCSKCGEQFHSQLDLDVHMSKHESDFTSVCNQSFGRQLLVKHKKLCSSSLHCTLCPREFALESLLETHVSEHKAGKYRYQCYFPNCTWAFREFKYFTTHMKEHGQKVRCTTCYLSLDSHAAYECHMKNAHRNPRSDDAALQCHYCKRPYPTSAALLAHPCLPSIKYTSSTPPCPRPLATQRCQWCKRSFLHKAELTTHIRQWHPGKPWNNEYVSETTEEAPGGAKYNCPFCDVKFQDVQKLYLHLERHVSAKSASDPSNNVTRPKSSTDTITFVCFECDSVFQDKKNFAVHMTQTGHAFGWQRLTRYPRQSDQAKNCKGSPMLLHFLTGTDKGARKPAEETVLKAKDSEAKSQEFVLASDTRGGHQCPCCAALFHDWETFTEHQQSHVRDTKTSGQDVAPSNAGESPLQGTKQPNPGSKKKQQRRKFIVETYADHNYGTKVRLADSDGVQLGWDAKQPEQKNSSATQENSMKICDVRSLQGFVFHCSPCNRYFEHGDELTEHMQRFHPDKPQKKLFVCEPCGMNFREERDFNAHLRHFHGKSNDSGVRSRDNGVKAWKWKEYFRNPTSEKVCPRRECGQQFPSYKELKSHIICAHENRNPASEEVCPWRECGQRFKSNSELKSHIIRTHEKPHIIRTHKKPRIIRTHENSQAIETDSCVKSWKEFYRNLASENVCPWRECGQQFPSHKELKSHIICTHELELKGQVVKRLQNGPVVARPVNQNTPKVQPTCECPWPNCGKKFKTPGNLKAHVICVHETQQKGPCEKIFDETWKVRTSLSASKLALMKLRTPVVCLERLSDARVQKYLERQDPRLTCMFCGKVFTTERSRDFHTQHVHRMPSTSPEVKTEPDNDSETQVSVEGDLDVQFKSDPDFPSSESSSVVALPDHEYTKR